MLNKKLEEEISVDPIEAKSVIVDMVKPHLPRSSRASGTLPSPASSMEIAKRHIARLATELSDAKLGIARLETELSDANRHTVEIEKELADIKEKSLCIACMAEPRSLVTMPCGHFSLCPQCAHALTTGLCPICNGPFTNHIAIYLV